jgi:hypothetical protein
MTRFDLCPECGAVGAIAVIDHDGDEQRAVCSVCFVHLRHSLTDGRWKAESYGE